MGITFFEDDEILSYVEREMLGVQLIDEKPRRGGTKNECLSCAQSLIS